MTNTIKEILNANESEDKNGLFCQYRGYEFDIEKDLDGNGDWYIQVRPIDGCYDYDGWWRDSSDKSLESAINQAMHGAMILDHDYE